MVRVSEAGEKLFSISELAELTTLDRATVKKRLAEIDPTAGARNAKSYSLKVALPALIAGASAEMDEAKLRRAQAEAELKEIALAEERGDLLPVKEVQGYLLDLFKRLQQRLAVQLPRDIAAQLYKAESPAQITDILQREAERIFNGLRSDHKSFR